METRSRYVGLRRGYARLHPGCVNFTLGTAGLRSGYVDPGPDVDPRRTWTRPGHGPSRTRPGPHAGVGQARQDSLRYMRSVSWVTKPSRSYTATAALLSAST